MPEFSLHVIRRILRPYALDELDTFDDHSAAHMGIWHIKQFKVRHEAARSDTKCEAALAQMIELCSFGGDKGGMAIGQIHDRSPERQTLTSIQQIREEHQGRGDSLTAR